MREPFENGGDRSSVELDAAGGVLELACGPAGLAFRGPPIEGMGPPLKFLAFWKASIRAWTSGEMLATRLATTAGEGALGCEDEEILRFDMGAMAEATDASSCVGGVFAVGHMAQTLGRTVQISVNRWWWSVRENLRRAKVPA